MAINRVEQPDGYLSSYSLGQIFTFILQHSCSVIRSSWLNVADCGRKFSVVLVIVLEGVPMALCQTDELCGRYASIPVGAL